MSQEFSPEVLLGSLNAVESKNAPKRLFTLGNTEILKSGARISVVGSRKVTDEGRSRAQRLAAHIAHAGHVVVSGLATGIDSAAHRSAIEAGGRTIAVIGTPLDRVYPAENRELQELIAREHLLISQFPTGYRTSKSSFPMRNRTMALLSDATVIVEAGENSGTLHQGWEALRLGRGLFILKNVADNQSWPEKFLQYGAEILSDENFDEFLAALPVRTTDVVDGVLSL